MIMLGAEPLAALPSVRHGFFTRNGGVSEGPFASLNCGLSAGDEPARVAENRARATARLDLPWDALCTPYQCHGTHCIAVTSPWPHDARPKADALVTDRPGLALGVLTADCAPVLLADASARVVGIAHAGWRGALAGVLEAAVGAMAELGAAPANVVAAVGPCIGPNSYEVGPEFRAAFLADDPANEGFFTPAQRGGHAMFDLAGYIAGRLAALGLGDIVSLAHDTCADAERFFSYRRSCLNGEPSYGRLISAIALTS